MFARCLLAPRASPRRCGPLTGQGRSLYSKVKPLSKECSEVEIEVPWGKVAGKLWGEQSGDRQPILAFHGWQDNSSTFDHLAPLLLRHGPILAVDWPGHGLSSWLPPGFMYTEYVYLTLIERLRRYFGWKTLKTIGHSLGAQMLFLYTGFLPQQVEFVIALDFLKPVMVDFPVYYDRYRRSIDSFFKLDAADNDAIPCTKEEYMEKWKQSAIAPIDDKSIETLFDRGTVRTEDGRFIPSRDPKVKILPFLNPLIQDNMRWMAERISCPYMLIKAKDSPHFDPMRYTTELLDSMRTRNKDVHYVELPGQHHLHISNATDVAHHVNIFLDKYNA